MAFPYEMQKVSAQKVVYLVILVCRYEKWKFMKSRHYFCPHFKFLKRWAKILTRVHNFLFFIVSLKDIGKIIPPDLQLFMMSLFALHKERSFRLLNGLDS